MSYVELMYNLVKMWGRFGLKDIVSQNGVFLFKFRESEGLNYVLENGPWMVNNKPFMVQRRDPSIIMDKKDHMTLPCWIKLYNVPLEAWTVKGISAIASGLGNPLIMDKTTTRLCKEGTAGSLLNAVIVVKFGHHDSMCGGKKGTDNITATGMGQNGLNQGKIGKQNDGYRRMGNGDKSRNKNLDWVRNEGGNKKAQSPKPSNPMMEFRHVQRKKIIDELQEKSHPKNDNVNESKSKETSQKAGSKNSEDPKIQLQNEIDIVNKFVKNHRQPTLEDSKKWSQDEEDVYEDEDGVAEGIVNNELNGKVSHPQMGPGQKHVSGGVTS
ncbi:RNA-directed DNA polymerase, eukaryota, reverse transcriptase zinc-binding domain protein [Tanacetum coccineum]